MTDDLIQGWNDLKDGLTPAYLLQEYGNKLAAALEAAKRENELLREALKALTTRRRIYES